MATRIRFRHRRSGREVDHPGGRRKQRGEGFVATDEIRAFFRLFTLIWAAYFFLKAVLFLWMAWTMPMLEAMALRSAIGGVSLGGDDRDQRHAGPAALLPVPALRSAGRSRPRPRPAPKAWRVGGMTVRSDEAAAMLADVEQRRRQGSSNRACIAPRRSS